MSKRSAIRWSGNILDPLPGQEHLEELTVLERGCLSAQQRKAPIGPRCCCPPAQRGRLGGCRPALVADGDRLKPICRTCLKALVSGEHRRRDQTHVIGLAELPMDHVDLADLEAAGLLVDLSPIEAGLIESDGEPMVPAAFAPMVAAALRSLELSPIETGEVPQEGLR
jgi:hypothetical protein